jgi:hypothetical protein
MTQTFYTSTIHFQVNCVKTFFEDLYKIRWGYPDKDFWKVIDK